MKKTIAVLLLLFIGFIGVIFSYNCTPIIDGQFYDFSPLQRSTDYELKKQQIKEEWNIYLNFCVAVNERACLPNVAVCQVWNPNCPNPGCGSASLGSASSVAYSKNGNDVVATFTGGDGGRESVIRFICEEDSGVGQPVWAGELITNEYDFTWKTQYACPFKGTCKSCVNAGDKWCLDSSQCVPINSTYCNVNYVTNPNYCPVSVCIGKQDCSSCLQISECVWCLDNQKCAPSNQANCSNPVDQTKYCNLQELH